MRLLTAAPLLALLAIVVAACAGSNVASSLASAPAFDPKGQTKCGVTKSQAKPLIVEWPSADRGELETRARQGLVAVRYEGCEMEVLDRCKVPGSYAYSAMTRKDDRITIRDADELYASIPVHAAKFEAKLQKSGELNVAITLVGRYAADRASVRTDELQGDCSRATHFVSALTAGAFEFFAGADAAAGGGATLMGAGAGARSESKRELLNRDGDKTACERATMSDKAPPDGCGALVRVEVTPIELGDENVCARACSRLAACGVSYDRYCMDQCRAGGTFRACAQSAPDECNAVAMCVWRQWAEWNCKGGGGIPIGSASCRATTDCQNACNRKGDLPCGQCGCVAQLNPSRAADLLSSNACALNKCSDRCKLSWTSPDCGACWNENCASQYDQRCKAP